MRSKPLRRTLSCLLCAALLLAVFTVPAGAAGKTVTLSFDLGEQGVQTVSVRQGEKPAAGQVPQVPEKAGYQILGWVDQNGRVSYPATAAATQDMLYTPSYYRTVEYLLNTTEHLAYMKGSAHLFRPKDNLSRAEAAQIFYTLLRNQDVEPRSFSDVNGEWYAQAVGVMAGLGVINGYGDGTFRPGKAITRAEFVTMAVACDAVSASAPLTFRDVPEDYWAAGAIATAAKKGWIDGFGDGTFRPGDLVTRAQAATIVNRMLGRIPDSGIQGKQDAADLWDLFPDAWFFSQVMEATVDHSFTQSGGSETWTGYTKDATVEQSRWVTTGGKSYYLDGSTRQFLRGEQIIDGVRCVLDSATGEGFTGTIQVGRLRRIYENGRPAQGQDYLFDELGQRYTGYVDLGNGTAMYYELGLPKDDTKYLLQSDGTLYTGYVNQGDGTALYYERGLPKDSTVYQLDDSGNLLTGVKTDGDGVKSYYEEGRLVSRGDLAMDSVTGKPLTGFKMLNGYRRYYQNGVLQNDISGLGVVSGPYFIKVYKNANYLIIYAKDENGNYNTPVRAMRTSCGNATPVGTFYTPNKYRWLQMVGDTWAQWCTQIQGNFLFHSVPNWTKNNADLEVGEYNHLGETRSLGCVRLNCRDAKWIYDNCSLGTRVTITTGENSGPLAKPDGIQIPSWHTWDPTDPTAYWRCQERGCH